MGHRPHSRPRVLFSRCLALDACRYDGAAISDDFVSALRAHVEAVDVCPEVAIGLGVPRPPIRLVGQAGPPRLIQPSTGRDLTGAMQGFTTETLATLPAIDGAVLKSRSPSCGLGDAKRYATVDDLEPTSRDMGLFARGVSEAHAGLAISDEASLSTPAHRARFLERLFILARLRAPEALSEDLKAQLRHLLAVDEAHHGLTLRAALPRASSAATRATIEAALAAGPAPSAALPPLVPAGLLAT